MVRIDFHIEFGLGAPVQIMHITHDLEKRIVISALLECRGNKSQAARILGLNRTTFVERIKKHGVDEAMLEEARCAQVLREC